MDSKVAPVNITLLIIDDNSTDRVNCIRLLQKSSQLACEIIEAENASMALAALDKTNIDCVLLDYKLPDQDGIEVLKVIKDKFGELIPVIMLTGQGSESIAVSAMKEGAADYLVKDTIDSQIIIKTVVNAIKTAQLKQTIQEQKERLEYYAYYDSLTGLINRHTFEELVHQAIIYAQRHNDMLAVILIDLDNFMSINESLGQLAGDDILIETAHRIKNLLPDDAILARWGNDEFIVMLTGPDIEKLISTLSQAILKDIKKRISLTNEVINVSATIGVACYPTNCKDVNRILKNAYSALNYARKNHHGTIQQYTSDMK